MSGKPLTNISNGKTGDSWGLRASDAGLCAVGVGEQGWQSRGAVRLRGQAGRRRPWLAVSQVHDFRPAKPRPPPRHSRVRTACLGGLRGQAHGAQVQGALAQRPGWQT